MKLLSLKLRGFIGIRESMELDTIHLDFSNVNGLVAIHGENGSGKTTILESMQPYRSLMSRPGALYHHVFLRDSIKELMFEMNGDVYKTSILIDSKTGYSEGFIHKNGSNESIVDGKVENYDKFINDLFGTKSLFTNSVFCAQNSTQISDLTTSEFKVLLSEILPLDKLITNEAIAKNCVKILENIQSNTAGSMLQLKKNIKKMEDLDDRILNNENTIIDKTKNEEDINKAIEKTSKQIDAQKTIINTNDNAINRIKDIEISIDDTLVELNDDIETTNKNIQILNTNISDVTAEIERYRNLLKHESSINIAEESIALLNKDIDESRLNIENAFIHKRILGDKIAKCEASKIEAQHQIDLNSNSSSMFKLNSTLNDLMRNIEINTKDMKALRPNPEFLSISSEIKNAERKAETLKMRDSECISMTCGFITDALEAKSSMKTLEERKLEIIDSINSIENNYNDEILMLQKLADKERNSIDAKAKALHESTITQKKIIEIEINEIEISNKANIKLDTEIDIETINIDNANDKIKDLKEIFRNKDQFNEAHKKIEELEAKRLGLKAEVKIVTRMIDNMKKSKNSSIEKSKEKIAKIFKTIDSEADGTLAYFDEKLQRKNGDLREIKKAIKALSDGLLLLNSMLETRKETEDELLKLENKILKQKKEIAEWRYVRDACSKKGLQSLEIDGAAPLITDYANQLLSQSLSKTMSIKLITQDKETKREILDIIVIREDGSETLLHNMSGGEKVFILKALRLAITLVAKQKSNKDYTTFFSDEEDGALDQENATNFIGLYRSLMDIGNFDTGFYISHNPNVIDMADKQIIFTGSGINIR